MSFIHSPRVTIFPDAHAAARVVAIRLAKALRDKPTLVFGLATGRTPIELYDELARGGASRPARAPRDKPPLVFGLATGRTPIELYDELARLTVARALDWSH